MSSMELEEEERRRNEINMFAAMALADVAETTTITTDTTDTSAATITTTVAVDTDALGPISPGPDPARDSFVIVDAAIADDAEEIKKGLEEEAQEATAADSGTFQYTALPAKRTKRGERNNLEAAAAALSRSEQRQRRSSQQQQSSLNRPPNSDMASVSVSNSSGNTTNTTATTHQQQQQQRFEAAAAAAAAASLGQLQDTSALAFANAPMFAEKVILPRPLFFGALVPPRVLIEGRRMVQQAVQDLPHGSTTSLLDHRQQQTAATETPVVSLVQMPESVRNLVGALRTFGYGLDDFLFQPENDNTDNVNGDCFPKAGDAHVCTYQPVWGEDARAARILQFQQLHPHRPRHISVRSSTAPPNLGAGLGGQDAAAAIVQRQQSPPFTITTTAATTTTTAKPEKPATATTTTARTSSANNAFDPGASFSTLASGNSSASGGTGGGGSSGSPATNKQPPQATGEQSGETTNTTRLLSANEQFSAWLRGGTTTSDDNHSLARSSSAQSVASTTESNDSLNIIGGGGGGGEPQQQQQQQSLTETEQFALWARGGGGGEGGGADSLGGSDDAGRMRMMQNNTFQKIPVPLPRNESDDDSVVDNELKKQVGISVHMSKAIASLAATDNNTSNNDEGGGQPQSDVMTAEESKGLLSQTATNANLLDAVLGHHPHHPQHDGTSACPKPCRPLTNYELTNGCVPLFGLDDAPLPVEADLGVHETKDDQQRSNEQKRSQELIEKFVAPSVFCAIACPNPALNPDDFHSWNNRATQIAMTTTAASSSSTMAAGGAGADHATFPTPRRHPHVPTSSDGSVGTTGSYNNYNYPSHHQHYSSHNHHRGGGDSASKQQRTTTKSNRTVTRSRYGWWNVANNNKKSPALGDKEYSSKNISPAGSIDGGTGARIDTANTIPSSTTAAAADSTIQPQQLPLQLPPQHHSSTATQVMTSLLEHPTPQELCEANLPLSRMHAASSMAETLPYLSDRPPSYRYIQIDTQAVGFRPVGAEIEPLFCTLAIYNVETVSNNTNTIPTSAENGGMSSAGIAAAAAAADHAPVPDLQRCGRVTEALHFDVVSDADVAERCTGALWPYAASRAAAATCNPSGDATNTTTGVDTKEDGKNGRLQGSRCGVFPIPSNLNVSNLYAVLIVRKVLHEESDFDPYLKVGYTPPDVERLRSRAEKASSRFGHFLVPFAFGVAPLLQVFGADNPMLASSRAVQIPLFRFLGGERHIIDHIMVMLFPRADHRASGIGGPAAVTNGGTAMLVMRNFGYLGLHTVVDKKSSLARDRLVDFTGELQLRVADDTPEDGESKEDETVKDPYTLKLPDWHSRFIAEPAIEGGRNCVDEVSSEMKGSKSHLYAQELAPLPLQLVPSAGKPGVPRGRLHGDDIEPTYHLSFCNELLFHPRLLHNCSKGNIAIEVELRELEWKQDFNGYFAHLPMNGPSIHNCRRGSFLVQNAFTSCSPRGGDHHFIDEFKVKLPLDLKPRQPDNSTRTLSLFFTVYNVRLNQKSKWKRAKKILGSFPTDSSESEEQDESRLQQIACGFLPLTSNACLVENGLHDVRVIYVARKPPKEYSDRGIIDPSTLILIDKNDGSHESQGTLDSCAEDDSDCKSLSNGETNSNMANLSELLVDESRGGKAKASVNAEPISLSVRIFVHSSLHSQNEALALFLNEEPDLPRLVHLPSLTFMSKIKKGRDFLANNLDIRNMKTLQPTGDKLLELTIDISKHQHCTVPQSTSHLLRIMSLLWRFTISGNGEPDLVWANPSAPLPLRVHAFATILHLLGSSTMYLSKNGVTLVDGVTAWNVVALGRVLALAFDEQKLFGGMSTETIDEDLWLSSKESSSSDGKSSPGSPSEKQKKRRHIRNNYDLFNDLPPREDSRSFDFVSPQAGTLHNVRRSPKRASLNDVDTKAVWLEEPTIVNSETPVSPSTERQIKVDSKSDFQSALRAVVSDDDSDGLENDGGRAARAMIQAFGGTPSGSRRLMTAPGRALSTIRESDDNDDAEPGASGEETTSTASPSKDDLAVRTLTKTVKQMRVPGRGRDKSKPPPETESAPLDDSLGQVVPKTDEEIETAGAAFLEAIGKSLGVSSNRGSQAGEERRVGSSHHRKTHSRGTSIDWSLIAEVAPAVTTPTSKTTTGDHDESMSTLKKEEATFIRLPNFVDRLALIGKKSDNSARIFPYAYEVVIMQWCAILVSQRRLTEKAGTTTTTPVASGFEVPDTGSEAMAHAAVRSIGVAIASAPMLFEIIKNSLGFRISSLFRAAAAQNSRMVCPPLVKLDETLLLNLELAISMVSDACLDSRNFDSWELRRMSIDVNDSIVRFLRDMFSFLAPECVHRLILIYVSRFVTKEGKQWQDRDSGIGLRCSWEITKLRINAVTALVRFPDFVRVNAPQMLNWRNLMAYGPTTATPTFFDEVLEHYRTFRLLDLVGGDEAERKLNIKVPPMKPHWLSELVIDVCLLGIVHAEQYIQHRSASLLHELFWASSQYGALKGRSAPIGSMYVTFLEKLLHNVSYLSNFSPKSQLRTDILPCAIFVMEAAPGSLLRALWRRLSSNFYGKGSHGRSGDSNPSRNESAQFLSPKAPAENGDECDILDVFNLLNLSLKTMEYEGSEETLDHDSATDSRESVELWRRGYLLALRTDQTPDLRERRRPVDGVRDNSTSSEHERYTSSISRKWQSHDASLVVVNTAHHIVLEMYSTLSATAEGRSLLNPAVRNNRTPSRANDLDSKASCNLASHPGISYNDIILFVRGATSVYLHSLSLRESDIVVVRTFKLSAEAIKIFGIRIFLEALGETLQHWMRVLFLNCGARRALVRVEATDLLELILRSTWECYGSFFRIRVPLLAVQTEVMERIVATAAARFYRNQRLLGTPFLTFSHLNAECSLVPLWRTLDRIEKQPASQNIAFRGALIRMAEKLKKLYRAYVAARVLSFIQGSGQSETKEGTGEQDHEMEAVVRARRISVLRVINASEGHSKQFLGFQGTSRHRSNLAHFEAVEDALIDAADVFSPTELPEHRVAWLRMLADFHRSRKKFAEEATCHFYIHMTLQQAARLHGSLWSNTPFLPWTDNMSDPVYIDGQCPTVDPDYDSELEFDGPDGNFGGQMENANSFRRIFYRVANSVGMANEDWDTGASKTLFYGVAYPYEYTTVSPWITLRQMEENMVEEAEAAGELFLQAGILQSCRFSWNLATQYYAEKFNFAKLALVYGNLARAVVTQVPAIDTSLPQEVWATLGRFYRVWFHGGAPDELSGVEFVYRTESSVRLPQFGEDLRDIIKSIIPDLTPIHLLLDGRTQEKLEEGPINYGFSSRIGPAPLEPVRIKVTPLRPLSRAYTSRRGLPEWFLRYVEEAYSDRQHKSKRDMSNRLTQRRNGSALVDDVSNHLRHSRDLSATVFSTGSGGVGSGGVGRDALSHFDQNDRSMRSSVSGEDTDLAGVDKFCFVQPKDSKRTSKEWWKSQQADFAEKTLKVTQLQVTHAFPACVARQEVVHRVVYSQSPLEAGVDAICQWCAVLFRTAVATAGQAALGENTDPGIGTDAAKVVADCIHSSNVKEMGLALLQKNLEFSEGDNSTEFSLDYDHLTEDEVKKLRCKIARLTVVFIELLHLLISRNRDLLLDVIQERKKGSCDASPHTYSQLPPITGGPTYVRSISLGDPAEPTTYTYTQSLGRDSHRRESPQHHSTTLSLREGRGRETPTSESRQLAAQSTTFESSSARRTGARSINDGFRHVPPTSLPHRRAKSSDVDSVVSTSNRTDSAIAVQSELQRAFINLCKSLYPRVQGVMQDETPRWLKQCAQDNYFSLGTYRLTKIPIAEELCFNASETVQSGTGDTYMNINMLGSHQVPSEIESPRSFGGGKAESSSQSIVSKGSDNQFGSKGSDRFSFLNQF